MALTGGSLPPVFSGRGYLGHSILTVTVHCRNANLRYAAPATPRRGQELPPCVISVLLSQCAGQLPGHGCVYRAARPHDHPGDCAQRRPYVPAGWRCWQHSRTGYHGRGQPKPDSRVWAIGAGTDAVGRGGMESRLPHFVRFPRECQSQVWIDATVRLNRCMASCRRGSGCRMLMRMYSPSRSAPS